MKRHAFILLMLFSVALADTPPPRVTVTAPGNGLSIIGQALTLGVSGTSTTGSLTSTDWNSFNSKQSTLNFIDSLSESGTNVSLKNDSASPGDSQYYGTDSGGSLGYHALPGDLSTADLTSSPTTNLTVSGGTNAVLGSGTTLHLLGASIVEATSSVLNLTGAANAVLGTGVSIQVKQSSTSQSGYLSSTDWNTFNGKQPSGDYVLGKSSLSTAGGVSFVTSTGTIGEDSTQLFWDETNKRLGIGTNAPLSVADFNGGVAIGSYAGTAAAPSNGLIVSGQTLIGSSTDFPDVGGPHTVAITGPAQTNIFAVSDDVNQNEFVAFLGSNTSAGVQFGTSTDSNFGIVVNNSAPLTMFYKNGGVNIGADYNFNSQMPSANSLSVEGSVGVGTLTPLEVFEVVGNTRTEHIVGSTAAPAISAGSGAGTSPTISITGSDLAGNISVTPGITAGTAAAVVTVTFNIAYSVAPTVILTPANAVTAALGTATAFVSSTSTTTFVITSNAVALTPSTAYAWYYHVIQ